jgi:SAM-dependent methyltransferase
MSAERSLHALPPSEAWRKYDAIESRLTARVNLRMLELAGIVPGMHVLDIASGRGDPALDVAQRVGVSGRVVGIDNDNAVLQFAREKAATVNLAQVTFHCETAEEFAANPSSFDAATCRWGLMYLADPNAALRRIHAALKPDARLVTAVWAEPERVPWAMLSRHALAEVIDVSAPIPAARGPFRFARNDDIFSSFIGAGFTHIEIQELGVTVFDASRAAAIVDWCCDVGFAEPATNLTPPEQARFLEALAQQAERLRTGRLIELRGVTRIVTAYR